MKSFFSEKKILVAGGTGFVGVNLIKKLLEIDADVTATIHIKKPVVNDDRIRYVNCDLMKMKDCYNAVKGMDYVFMCAASTSGAAVIAKTPMIHVTPNIVMNAQLLEAAYNENIKKFLWISSSTGYPPSGKRKISEDEMLMGDPYEKYYFVGWMKRSTEVLCRMYSEKLKNPMTTIVLRPTNIYGDYDDFNFETSHVFAALIRRVVERHNPLVVWGDGEDIRDLIYVGDFVNAMLLAMEKVDSYIPMNIGMGDDGITVKELLKKMAEADGFKDVNVVFDPSKPTTIPVRLVDTSRARDVLGFVPEVNIEDGIKRTVKWYRENQLSVLQK